MQGLKSFSAGLFTFVFGIFLILTIFVFCVSGFASKENIVNEMKKTDVLTEVKKIRNSGSAEGQSGITQIIDEMYSLASQFSVSEEVVDKIIDSEITKEIIGDAAGNLTDYIINGKEVKALSADETYDLINDNLDNILMASDISLDEGQKEKFLREIKKQLPDIVEAIPSSDNLSSSAEVEFIHELFSLKVKVFLCVILIISMAIVIVLKRKDFKWCVNLGVSMLISGLLIIGIALIMPSIAIDMISATDISLIATSLINFLTKPILYSGFTLIILSILLFIFYKIMGNKKGLSS